MLDQDNGKIALRLSATILPLETRDPPHDERAPQLPNHRMQNTLHTC